MTHQEQHAAFLEQWDRLMDSCDVPRKQARLDAFARLVTAYSEPHRHYHNLEHIQFVLFILEAMNLKQPETVRLAAWYHDVIYDPRRSDNESRSAEAAAESLRGLGIDADRTARVGHLILMTKDHEVPLEDLDAAALVDADLAILATAEWRYAQYADAIRKEYAWVADRDYYQGRRKVLQGFLQRPRIFRVHDAKDMHGHSVESRARANLAAEIAQIEEKLRSMSS